MAAYRAFGEQRKQWSLTNGRAHRAGLLWSFTLIGDTVMNASHRVSGIGTALLLSLSFALAACAGMSAQEKGTATGAVIGGVAGNVAGGGLLGTAAGAVVGGVVGHEVTKPK
jgi:osmotically inducible lipoprotein OsmB